MGENAYLDAEALIVLIFFDAAVKNVKGSEEGKILMSMDCLKV